MKLRRLLRRCSKGYALLSVMMFLGIMAILTASMLKYSSGERRLNERNRLLLRARNMAENVAIYASEQLTTKLYRLRSTAQMAFMSGTNQIYLPPDDVLTSSFSSSSDVEVRAGLTESTDLQYVDPTDPANANDSNAGLSVSKSKVPIVAKATMHHPALGSVTAYAEQDLQIAMIPLFQFAVFYNMDMEFGPGPNMIISGPVHTNGNLIARIQTGMTNTLQFKERVTAVGGFYADTAYKGNTYMGDGSVDDGPGGTGPLYFQNPSGTVTNIKSSSGTWRDHKYGQSTETATTRNQFKTFATSTYGGNLRTSAHGVTAVELPSIGGYKETDDPLTPEDDTKNGRQIIEPSSPSDTADLVQAKFSRRSGLYIIVNPDDDTRNGSMPDGTAVAMRARSYRCFLNTVENDGTHTMTEVILPGQPSYGYLNANVNNLPNAYRTDTSVGSNQVLRIPQGAGVDPSSTGYAGQSLPTFPAITDAYFYDLRRGKGSNTYPFKRTSDPFVPRPIAKIDFDLTRFKMAVDRTLSGAETSNVYDLRTPSSTNWSSFIYNASASPADHGLGLGAAFDSFSAAEPFRIYFAPADPNDARIVSNPSVFQVGATDLVSTTNPSPWFDGITIYVDSVDAEVKTTTAGVLDRIDSGVRLWNGRGSLISLNGATYPGRTGFSFATNDAAYIVGHFNADGTINSNANSTGTGGYSGRYAESSSEMLCSVMGDAITILSQPVYVKSGSNYYESTGWADSLSLHRRSSGGWSSSWSTSNPSSSNSVDGINSSTTPASMPNLSTGSGSGSTETTKLDPSVTEVSTCLLTGIVRTTTYSKDGRAQTSGGVHNFPRLLENWNGTGLYIRGSMVAMFESQVATEPWSIRYYQGAGRFWGLHQNLRAENGAHDLPLEPVVLNAQRLSYRELTPAQYDTLKATIEALPH